MKTLILTTLILLSFAVVPSLAQEPDAETLMKEAHLNMYYPGDDGAARVQMTLTDKRGKTRERNFVILRRDWADGGEQRVNRQFLAEIVIVPDRRPGIERGVDVEGQRRAG